MSRRCEFIATLFFIPTVLLAQSASHTDSAGISRFNQALSDATRTMDNSATLTLWDEEGLSLLPDTKPIRGRAAIGDFMNRVTAGFPGAHMERFALVCRDLTVSGDWASEWCTEHQVVRFADGKPPFDGWGNLLFVLHRSADGAWRIRTEMWNQAKSDPASPGAG